MLGEVAEVKIIEDDLLYLEVFEGLEDLLIVRESVLSSLELQAGLLGLITQDLRGRILAVGPVSAELGDVFLGKGISQLPGDLR